jgi:hypothetical protein
VSYSSASFPDVPFRDLGDRFQLVDGGAVWIEMSTPERGRLAAEAGTTAFPPANFASDMDLAVALSAAVGWLAQQR